MAATEAAAMSLSLSLRASNPSVSDDGRPPFTTFIKEHIHRKQQNCDINPIEE